MIKTDAITTNTLRITASEKLKAGDLESIAPQIDSLVSQHGEIRLLIDASGFSGWENSEAFKNHAAFFKDHRQKIKRIAVIAAPDWPRCIIRAVGAFLQREVRSYDKNHESEALQWIAG
jgi:hypothetical protein